MTLASRSNPGSACADAREERQVDHGRHDAGAARGSQILIAEGPDEQQALDELAALIANEFDEN